jgi:hypothetical protein
MKPHQLAHFFKTIHTLFKKIKLINLHQTFELKEELQEPICPNQMTWNSLYEHFKHNRPMFAPPPPEPLIFDDWHFSSDLKKLQEWQKMEEWAKLYGFEEEIKKLKKSDYYYA